MFLEALWDRAADATHERARDMRLASFPMDMASSLLLALTEFSHCTGKTVPTA